MPRQPVAQVLGSPWKPRVHRRGSPCIWAWPWRSVLVAERPRRLRGRLRGGKGCFNFRLRTGTPDFELGDPRAMSDGRRRAALPDQAVESRPGIPSARPRESASAIPPDILLVLSMLPRRPLCLEARYSRGRPHASRDISLFQMHVHRVSQAAGGTRARPARAAPRARGEIEGAAPSLPAAPIAPARLYASAARNNKVLRSSMARRASTRTAIAMRGGRSLGCAGAACPMQDGSAGRPQLDRGRRAQSAWAQALCAEKRVLRICSCLSCQDDAETSSLPRSRQARCPPAVPEELARQRSSRRARRNVPRAITAAQSTRGAATGK